MSRSKIAISIKQKDVERLDQLVSKHLYSSRSQAIQEAVQEKLQRIERGRLAKECAKLDPVLEKALAEEGLSEDLRKWPKY